MPKKRCKNDGEKMQKRFSSFVPSDVERAGGREGEGARLPSTAGVFSSPRSLAPSSPSGG